MTSSTAMATLYSMKNLMLLRLSRRKLPKWRLLEAKAAVQAISQFVKEITPTPVKRKVFWDESDSSLDDILTMAQEGNLYPSKSVVTAALAQGLQKPGSHL